MLLRDTPSSRARTLMFSRASKHLNLKVAIKSAWLVGAQGCASDLDPNRLKPKLGIARETVRNQLKAVLAKTGTHRQGELIALLSRALMTAPGQNRRYSSSGYQSGRVGEDVATLTPHSSGRAELLHPVLHERVLLKAT
jgi:hypothetical protein